MSNQHALPKVLLTDAIHPDAYDVLKDAAIVTALDPELNELEAEHALRALVADSHGLIVRRRLPADIFDVPNLLRGVVRHGVGLDFIPVAEATTSGLPVANTPEVNANSVAEYVFAAMLEHARRLKHFDTSVRSGQWGVRKTAASRTFELRGKLLGVVGFGAIGKRISEIASAGFGMGVVAHTRNPRGLPDGIPHKSLDELFHISDFVVLACPLTEQTHGMIDRNVLLQAKPGLVLINVARGAVINSNDFICAVKSGHVSGAALDVFAEQPLSADSSLCAYPQIMLTPHIAGITQDAELAMGLLAVDTQLALIRGERPFNVVNPQVYKTKEIS